MSIKKLAKKEDNVEIKEEIPVEVEVTEEVANVYELIAGYLDENGTVHKEFEIREMTGADEEAIGKADIKINGGKVIRTILERCVTRIGTLTKKELGGAEWREVIQSLLAGDQDYIMSMIRKDSISDVIEIPCQCPSCNDKLKVEIEVDELEKIPFRGDFELHFELPKGYVDKKGVKHTTGIMTYPNGLDREILDPVARKNLGEANTLMLARVIKKLGTTHITNDVLRNLSIKDRNYLAKLVEENKFGLDLKSIINCASCGHEFEANLNAVNFI